MKINKMLEKNYQKIIQKKAKKNNIRKENRQRKAEKVRG